MFFSITAVIVTVAFFYRLAGFTLLCSGAIIGDVP
jgi:hypothetical protein